MTAGDVVVHRDAGRARAAIRPRRRRLPARRFSLSGSISALSGQCPSLSFTVSATPVFAIGSTGYSGGKCKDLRNGDSVTVTGTVQADRRVLATLIELSN